MFKFFFFILPVLGVVVFAEIDTHAQDRPPLSSEQKQYEKYFVHYIDNEGFWDRFGRSLGLESGGMGRGFALIAGVSEYPFFKMVSERKLKPADEDINKLVAYLKKNEFINEIIVLRNNDMNDNNLKFFFQDYLPNQFRRYPKSRFLFAYCGHGFANNGNGYLVQSKATKLSDLSNSINLSIMRIYLYEVIGLAHQVLVLINACHSGAFFKRAFGDSNRYFPPTESGAHAITAGGSDELCWHDPKIGTGSVFFEKFLAGVHGMADIYPKLEIGRSGDGIITIDELVTYLRQEVKIETNEKQNPIFSDISKNGSKGGFFFICENGFLIDNTMQNAGTVSKSIPYGRSVISLVSNFPCKISIDRNDFINLRIDEIKEVALSAGSHLIQVIDLNNYIKLEQCVQVDSISEKRFLILKIIDASAVYDLINLGDCLQWPNAEIKTKAGVNHWYEFYPQNGDVGLLIAEMKHCETGEKVYLLKIRDYYVPIRSDGVGETITYSPGFDEPK